MSRGPEFVTKRDSASKLVFEADAGTRRRCSAGLKKSLKNLLVAADSYVASGQNLKPRQIGHPIAFIGMSGERLLKTGIPGGPGKHAKLSVRESGVGSNFFGRRGCGHGGKSDGSSDG